jgi:hypothetical protein
MESGIRRRLNDENISMLHLRYKPRKGKKLHVPHSCLFLVRSLPSAQRINTPQTVENKKKKIRNNPQNLVGYGGSSSGTVSSFAFVKDTSTARHFAPKITLPRYKVKNVPIVSSPLSNREVPSKNAWLRKATVAQKGEVFQ